MRIVILDGYTANPGDLSWDALESFGHLTVYDRTAPEEVVARAKDADVVSLHCPLTPDTHHIINSRTLQLMKPSAILINTGRGPLVNDQDVADVLNSGRLYAYCADVLTEEPPRSDNPLLHCTNAYITPHIAWATKEARQRLIATAIANIQAFKEGLNVNVVS